MPSAGWRSWAAKAVLLAFAALLERVPEALASEISLPSQSAAPGSSLLFPAVFTPRASLVSGIQFDVRYDSSALNLFAIVGDAARNSGKSLYYADLAPNLRRFLVVGLNQNVIPGGSVITLLVNVNPNAPTGVYPLAFSNVVGVDPYGQSVITTATNGAVTIQGTISQSVRLQTAGVLNRGSLLPGPLAPGEVITLIGSGVGPASPQRPDPSPSKTLLADTSVLFDGTPAPLLDAAPNQIDAVVPYSVAGSSATQLQVKKGGQVIAELSMPVAPAVPAIFTIDSSGVGAGAILNQDSTVNSPLNPAPRGSVAVLFATGAGQTSPPGVDGQLGEDLSSKPVLPASVQIGGIEADVLSVSPAPGLISGVLQINCRVPLSTAPGWGVPIVLTVGNAPSQAGVTVALQ